jgi:hypothetical protein
LIFDNKLIFIFTKVEYFRYSDFGYIEHLSQIPREPRGIEMGIFRTRTFKNSNATGLETRKGDG